MDFDQDRVLLLVREQDMLKRMENGTKLMEYLNNLEDIKWDNIDRIVDALATYWVASSNFKVALLGLDIISLLVERLQEDFQLYYNSVHNALIDRLGDQKEQVRSASVTLFTNIMEGSASPQFVFDRLSSVFTHKVWRVREGVCKLLNATIGRFGARSLGLSKIVPHVCKLLSDPNGQVRDTALSTLGEIYRHVGDKVRNDIMKRGLPQNRLSQVLDLFDDIQRSGEMEVDGNETASLTSSGSFGSGSISSSTVNSTSGYMKPPTTSYVPNNHRVSSAAGRASSSMESRATHSSSGRRSAIPAKASVSEAGAVDDETFMLGMEKDLPKVSFYNIREFDDCMNRIQAVLSDQKKDWEERSKSLRTLRAVIANGGTEHESFGHHLRTLEPALVLNTRDLRSQVVRETCLTLAHLTTVLKTRFDHTAEVVFPPLFNLVPNSVKIMATSGVTTIRIIIRNTHAPRLIPIVTGNCASKSTAVRKRTYSFLNLLLQEWTTPVIEKQFGAVLEAVKRGISDADAEARSEARKCWWGLRSHFPVEAEQLYNDLTAAQQKMIQGQLTASSSTESIPKSSAAKSSIASKRPPRRSLLPNNAQRVPADGASRFTVAGRTARNNFSRSRSDIDPEAARRSAQKAMGFNSVGRVRQASTASSRQERSGRNSARPASSQPGSRSNSPNSRSRYYNAPRTPTGAYGRKSRTSSTYSMDDKEGATGAARTSVSSSSGYGPMRVLPKGREGEQVMSAAFSGRTPRRRSDQFSDNDDDLSDTSSVCSDRSSSYQSSRNGGRRTHSQIRTEDIAEILPLCQSTNWADRKEGLVSLHYLVKKEKLISRMEMKKILEIFNRMFADPHGKVFSLFLEILPDFISTYKDHIDEWLYVLMTQLLKKMGADLLGSVQAKVIKAMQTTRTSFPPKQQFTILTRYIVDQTQTPNLKVKVALLHYLLELTALMESNDLRNTSETRLAISRMITWVTEPKSQDVRKAAESVITSLFELNPGEFSQMLCTLPKTFQDGAMRVLHSHVKANGEPKSPTTPSTGRVTARVGMAPGGQVVSPHGSMSGMADIMSPRSSEADFVLSDRSGNDEIEETLNFNDITAGIHQLRMDSSEDVPDYKQSPFYDKSGRGDGHSLPPVCYPPPFQQLQNTPMQLSGNRGANRYNPGIYSEKTANPPYFNKEALFLDGGVIRDEMSREEAYLFAQLKDTLPKKSRRKAALTDFTRRLKNGEIQLSLLENSEDYFGPLLMHVLDCAKDEEPDTRTLALGLLKDMFSQISWNNFSDYVETVIFTVFQIHNDSSLEVVRAAEALTGIIGTFIPPELCFQVVVPFLDVEILHTCQAAIKLLTGAIHRARKDQLSENVVRDIVPCLIKGYDNPVSSMRKAAVFCLVAIHQVIGEENLQKHLSALSGSKMKLLQVYIKRSQASAH